MDEAPISEAEARNLRFLRILVTVLAVTMIFGLLTLVGLLVIRFSTAPARLELPATIALPEGARPLAFTRGSDWFAVVTDGDEILIFDAASGELRQRVQVNGK